VVVDALLYGETVRRFYQLHAWVVMPNHVHGIFRPHTAMPTIMRWLKGRTSRVANKILGRTGRAFWQDESFDHWIRSAEELQDLIEYVENNPRKAGLVEAKEQWRWSSAGWTTDDKRRSSVPPGATSLHDQAQLARVVRGRLGRGQRAEIVEVGVEPADQLVQLEGGLPDIE
jgi:REP element-mobilizing transposase RayT